MEAKKLRHILPSKKNKESKALKLEPMAKRKSTKHPKQQPLARSLTTGLELQKQQPAQACSLQPEVKKTL
jgi:hypothetical protein